jgi:hypothetical protein
MGQKNHVWSDFFGIFFFLFYDPWGSYLLEWKEWSKTKSKESDENKIKKNPEPEFLKNFHRMSS